MNIAPRKSMLLITYAEEIVDGVPIIVWSNSLPIKACLLGMLFMLLLLKSTLLIGMISQSSFTSQVTLNGSTPGEHNDLAAVVHHQVVANIICTTLGPR
ncbi:hypothetical protein ACS0TY_025651 [Phlomoides rotata]